MKKCFRVPDNLNGAGRKLWRKLSPQLLEQGILLPQDLSTFLQLCCSFDAVCLLRDQLKEEGYTLNGKKNPVAGALNAEMQNYLALSKLFYLSPKSRGQDPEIKEKKQKNEKEKKYFKE